MPIFLFGVATMTAPEIIERRCRACNGNGYSYGRVCTHCHGKGKREFILYAEELQRKGFELADQYNLDDDRVMRAVDIVQAGKVVRDSEHPGQHLVVSSRASEVYHVSDRRCDCPDALGGRVCKHRIARFLAEEFGRVKKE